MSSSSSANGTTVNANASINKIHLAAANADDEKNYHIHDETGLKIERDMVKRVGKLLEEITQTAKEDFAAGNGFKSDDSERPSKRQRAQSVPPCNDKGVIKNLPGVAMTGVEDRYTRLCATISGQIYKAKSAQDFDLVSSLFGDSDGQPKVIFYDDHGHLAETTPPIVAVNVDKTMIIAWRGSTTLMDWVLDVSFAPVSSSRWQHVAKNVRAQGGYCSLVESDLAQHEDEILEYIEQNSIEQLIFTGHSLAGGVANVAHLMIAGEREKATTPWKRSPALRSLTVRSVTFAPPMTAMLLDRSDQTSLEFLMNTVGKTSCSIVYKMDPVPHCYADVHFLVSLIRDVINEASHDAGWLKMRMYNIASLFTTGQRAISSVMGMLESGLEKQERLVCIAGRFQHFGAVVYYSNVDAKPAIMSDKGSYYIREEGDTTRLFRDIDYARPEEAKAVAVTIANAVTDHHNFLVRGPGLAYL